MHDDQFKTILQFFGLNWNGYYRVRKGVKKRLGHHMRSVDCRHVAAYLDLLARDAQAYAEAEKRLLVPISRFFRDAALWRLLEENVLHALIDRFPQQIRFWSAGCAGGEEVYSFKIVWDRLHQSLQRLPVLQVWATDANPHGLERAQGGVYQPASLKELPQALRHIYFKRSRDRRTYTIHPKLQQEVYWQDHHLLTPPPLANFEVIFLRNSLLTYYAPEIQHRALMPILSALVPGGFFCIGAKEQLPHQVKDLAPLPEAPFAFFKNNIQSRLTLDGE